MRRARIAAALVLSVLFVPGAARAGEREDVAKRWAPVFYQQVRDGFDLYTAFDFDGNWAGDDNGENMASCLDGKTSCDLSAKVYFTVIETPTHWFVQYLPYHARDTKLTNGHEHDTESVLAVVAKQGGATGTLQAIETRFHEWWFVYADGQAVKDGARAIDGPIHPDVDGRPQVYVQQVGHGICGGYSPPNDVFPDLQLICNHGDTPHLDGTGVVYRPDRPVVAPTIAQGKSVEAGYALEEIATTFWARRAEVGPGKTFLSLVGFDGERCNVLACPKSFGGAFMGDEGDPPAGPWDQPGGDGVKATGSQFFDPAYTMSKRLTFPAPFSLDYCHNPYVGIAAKCPDDAVTPDAGAGPSSTSSPASSPPSSSAPPPAPAAADPAPSDGAADSGCACSDGPGAPRSNAAWAVLALAFVAVSRRLSRDSSESRCP